MGARTFALHAKRKYLSAMNTILLPLLAFLLANIAWTKGEELFVSQDGDDTNPCTEDKPCKTVGHACDIATSGTTVHIQGGSEADVYDITNIILSKSLSLNGWEGTPTLKCGIESNSDDICNFYVSSTDPGDSNSLRFEDISTDNCTFCLTNTNLEALKTAFSRGKVAMELSKNGNYSMSLDSCNLEDVELAFESNGDENSDHQLRLAVKDSILHNPGTSLSFSNGNTTISDLQVTFDNVKFYDMQNPLKFVNFAKIHFESHAVELFNFTTSSHCIGIHFDVLDSTGEVTIRDSSFHDNFCFDGGLLIEGGIPGSTLTVTNCSFSNNVALLAGSGLKIISLPHAEVMGLRFYNNYNSESAAGLIVGDSNVDITNCDFRNNTVYTGNTLVVGQQNSWERKGAGGAVYVSGNSKVVMDNCTFLNNSADWFGGSIASFGDLTVQNSYFEHQETYRVNALGSMMYMTGPTKLENNICNATTVYTTQAMIWYTSDNKLSNLSWVDTGYMELYCPPGAQFMNSTLRASLDPKAPFKDFLYVCRSCDSGTYSLEQGYRIGPIYNDSPIWSSDFHCLECPYGGKCENGHVTAYENFWGFEVRKGNYKEISFLTCPTGYCCTGEECQSYDSCHTGRYGDLCGRCLQGSSELVFTTECYPNEKCHDYWYLAIDVVNAFVFLLMFLYQMEIGTFVATRILGQSAKGQKSGSPSAVNAYIKSLFYFYQTVSLLAVTDNRASAAIGLSLQPFIVGILSFSPIAALIAICPFPNMTPVVKVLLKTTPTVFIYFGLGICAIGLVVRDKWMTKRVDEARDREYITDVLETRNGESLTYERSERSQSIDSTGSAESRIGTTYLSHNFRARLSRACTNIFLLNYLTISSMTLAMLVCKNVGDKSVLFVDGTINCIAPWQALFIIVAILHTVPFFMAVIVSRALLDDHKISVTQFFLSYVMPLPMLIYWAAIYGGEYWRRRKMPPIESDIFVSMTSSSAPNEPDVVFINTQKDNSIKQEILFIVEDPYLKIGLDRSKSVLYWEGILIFRRLVLLMMLVFTTNPLLQMTLQTTTCLIFLLWHTLAQPFRSRAANMVEAVSLSVLTIVGILHTIQATFMSAGRRPSGPNDLQITITDWIEWVLVSLPPLLVMTLIIILVIFRIVRLIVKGVVSAIRKLISLCAEGPPCRRREEYHDLE